MKEFSDLGTLLAHLGEREPLSDPIIIDGWSGAGKSSLARSVAKTFNRRLIRLDCYILSRGSLLSEDYVAILDLERLRADLKSESRCLVMEGICVSRVAEAVGVKPGLRIYVKLIDDDGRWKHQSEFRNPTTRPPFGDCMQAYLRHYKPHVRSDIRFLVRDDLSHPQNA